MVDTAEGYGARLTEDEKAEVLAEQERDDSLAEALANSLALRKAGEARAVEVVDSFLSASRTAAASDLALAVTAAAEEEEQSARLSFVVHQRDALLRAAQATRLFLQIGGLVTRDDVERWRGITGSADFSQRGLYEFVTEMMRKAGVA